MMEVSGSNGNFSGKGRALVPYLDNMLVVVEFDQVSVNTDYRLTGGQMDVKGFGADILPDGVNDFLDELDESLDAIENTLDDIATGLDVADSVADQVQDLANDILDDGPLTIEDEERLDAATVAMYLEGAQQAAGAAAGALAAALTPESIETAAREVARAMELTKRGRRLRQIHDNADTLDAIAVEFFASENYGFDISRYRQHRLHYNIMVTADDETHRILWVATAAGQQETVSARLTGNTGTDAADVAFESDGTALQATMTGDIWSITLPAMEAGAQRSIVALSSTTGAILGKLDAIAYEPIGRKVNLVPVGSTPAGLNAGDILTALNNTYRQAVASWEVAVLDPLTVDGYTGTLQDDEQALLSVYSTGMREIIRAFEATGAVNEDEFYLFLVDRSQVGNTGYMPRKHRYGFIYMEDNPDVPRTVAHELGHGAFRLQHTFEEYPIIGGPRSTANLMDYGTGTKLRKYQWDLIHNPPLVIGLLEDEGEGALVSDTIFVAWAVDSLLVDESSNIQVQGANPLTSIGVVPTTGFVVVKDSEDSIWMVDNEGNVSQGGSEGGNTPDGTTETDSVLFVQKELIKEVLEHYKEEINLWMENNGKGPLDEALLRRLMAMPDCLPEDEGELESILAKIEEYLADPEALLNLVKENDAKRERIEELTTKLKGNQPPYAAGLSETEWDELLEMICPYLLPEEENVSEIVVVYNNRTYKNNESIYVFGETSEIVLEAASEETLEGLSWEGATGSGLNATVDLSSIGEEGIEVKANTNIKTTTVKVVKVKSMVKVTSVDKYFAPTVENLDIAYEVKSDTLKHAKIEIFKNGDNQNPIYMDTTIAKAGSDLKISWDGKMNAGADKGRHVSVFDSPYTVKISVTFDSLATYSEGFNDTDDTNVEIESLTLTPNGKEILYKPSRTAVEIDKDIEAQVLIKNKQKNGVPTSLPFTVHWSFEDPDDPSSNRNIDLSGSSGNDNTLIANGGKSGASSVMWKPQSGFVSNINYTTAETNVSIHGQDLAKAKIKFSSSVIAGDNYILVAQIKGANGTVIKEEKTQEWLVRKQHSFNRIYEMAGGHNMTQMMSTNNIDPAYSQDGCTDYTLQAGAVINLTGANAPEFVVSLSPPNQAETPTAQELQDYASNNPAVSGPAQVAITAKAQAWFNRVNSSLPAGKNAYLQQAGIQTPAIIGARYYHPKLDGRPGQTNYYPAGIIINCANGSNQPIYKDPDDDWRSVQGFRDSQDNAWIFLNISSTQRQQVVARHEIGHTSDHECFDNGNCRTDHASSGLMHFSGDMSPSRPAGDADFSDDSITKLRGRN
jgi:hypothetical protein